MEKDWPKEWINLFTRIAFTKIKRMFDLHVKNLQNRYKKKKNINISTKITLKNYTDEWISKDLYGWRIKNMLIWSTYTLLLRLVRIKETNTTRLYRNNALTGNLVLKIHIVCIHITWCTSCLPIWTVYRQKKKEKMHLTKGLTYDPENSVYKKII